MRTMLVLTFAATLLLGFPALQGIAAGALIYHHGGFNG